MNEVLEKLRTLITAALGSTYTVIEGYVTDYSTATMPLIEIQPVRTLFMVKGRALYEDEFEIDIRASVNLKDYYSNTTTKTAKNSMKAVVDIFENRDTDRSPLANTILGTIIANLSLEGLVGVVNNYQIDYTYVENVKVAQATMRIVVRRQVPTC